MKTPTLTPSSPERWRSFATLFTALATMASFSGAQDFTQLNLEELAQIQVTSIARKQGSLFDTSAAAYVLTGEDIHRLGATDLASALRPVPGMQVGRIDAVNHAISARGFNDSTSSKLLVLMDGRSLYSQTFSGAYWNYHELFFEDLDRIEVIRGPGATLWGANAVNGVINIVSKSAFSTVGSLLSLSHGDHLEAVAAVRQGWQFGRSAAIRVYGRYQDNDNHGANIGTGANGWDSRLLGSRFDWKRSDGAMLTLIGEYRKQQVSGIAMQPSLLPPLFVVPLPETRVRQGGHLLARWRQRIATAGEITLQTSYERMQSEDLSFGEKHGIFDADLQFTLRPGGGHEILAGTTLRRDQDRLASTPSVSYAPANATTTFVGAFVQDEMTVVPGRFLVTVGAKIERNTFTGWETQPGVRALWHPYRNQSVWAAASRAARTPSRAERSIKWQAAVMPPTPEVPLPTLITAKGSSRFDSEHMTAIEIGHRIKASRGVSFDTALFLNRYRDMRGLTPTLTPFVLRPVPHVDYQLEATNNIRGSTYGGEFLTRWRAHDSLNFEGSVSTVRYDLESVRQFSLPDSSVPGLVGTTPHWESKLRVTWDFRDDWTLDTFVRRTGALPHQKIPAYTGLDLHLGWRPRHDLEIELIGQNLLDARHPEALPNFLGGAMSQINRSYHLRITYRR